MPDGRHEVEAELGELERLGGVRDVEGQQERLHRAKPAAHHLLWGYQQLQAVVDREVLRCPRHDRVWVWSGRAGARGEARGGAGQGAR